MPPVPDHANNRGQSEKPHAWMVANELANKSLPSIVGPLGSVTTDDLEGMPANYDNGFGIP